MKALYTTVDAYIEAQDEAVKPQLCELRALIQNLIPQAQETISWGMPTYVYYGNLVHFAAHKHHLGFYPGEDGITAFKTKLQPYKYSKGAVQFPYKNPLPLPLIQAIIQFRIRQNEEAVSLKKKKR